jgi:hypothetical protein
MKITAHERAVVNRLKQPEIVGRFKGVRSSFGFGGNIGLGSLPLAHTAYSAAMVSTDIKIGNSGEIVYSIPGRNYLEVGVEHITVPAEEAGSRIAVVPETADEDRSMHIVSIFQRKGYLDAPEPIAPDTAILNAPENVFIGLFAHEFAHLAEMHDRIVPEALCRVEEWQQDSRWDNPDRRIPLLTGIHSDVSETKYDIIGAATGYAAEIVQKLDYMIDCISGYNGNDDPRYYRVMMPQDVVRQLEYRRAWIKASFFPGE